MEDEVIPLETGWRCQTCCVVSPGVKKLEVEKCPRILIVTLKRFKCTRGGVVRVGTQVGIVEKIDFGGVELLSIVEVKSLVIMLQWCVGQMAGYWLMTLRWICLTETNYNGVLTVTSCSTKQKMERSTQHLQMEGPRHVQESRKRGRNSMNVVPSDDVAKGTAVEVL